jgi:uncharacterized protein YndB with AHSA1/START domain
MMKFIEKSCIVDASLESVWQAWTTSEGAEAFFAPKADIELAIGGKYELLFDLDSPEGLRGSEGMKIQSFIPERMLAFDWNAPPSMPDVRSQKTWVVLEFIELDEELCEATLFHLGWGEGKEWDEAYAYFERAWSIVLSRFEKCMRVGPIDWQHCAV